MSYSPLQHLASFASLRLCVKSTLVVCVIAIGDASAADNVLSPLEEAVGWKLLFDGQSLDGWKNNDGKPVAAKIEDGAINVHGTGGYVLVYDKPEADFVLKCDVKMCPPECNSGVFVRTGNLADPVQSGLEVQVYDGNADALHDFGAIYDLVPPSRDATHGSGEWNRLEIRCEGPAITVKVNDVEVAAMNCDEWTEPGRRPDGTSHKFTRAIKDFPRRGYLGLQDHGHDVWYKNIKLLEL